MPIKLKDYPYGKSTKTLKSAVQWLNKNKANLIESGEIDDIPFDYPNYWGMPRSVCSRLSSDQVDWLQDETYSWWTGSQ